MTRKIILCFDKEAIPFASPLVSTIPQATIKIIIVRIAVAKLEFTFVMPTLAKIAVSDANKADNKAYIHHIVYVFKNVQLSVAPAYLSLQIA